MSFCRGGESERWFCRRVGNHHREFREEAELHSLASAAYRAYRRHRYKHLKLEAPYQWIRNKFGPHYPPKEVRRNVKIRFIGVWDTVAAYGMPVDHNKLIFSTLQPGEDLDADAG